MTFPLRQRPLPAADVRLASGFLADRQRALIGKGLLAQHAQLEATGRIENLRRAASRETSGFQGKYFNDSDVYKWVEACAYALAIDPNAAIRKQLEDVVDVIARAQMDDGYLNSYFQLGRMEMRWRNLTAMHEMYCAGHLIEAGVAHFECTGQSKLLDVAVRLARHIADRFGGPDTLRYCGHEELELALIRLSHATGEPEYRSLAERMVRARGSRPSPFERELGDRDAMALSPWMPGLVAPGGSYSGEYFQDHLPIEEQTAVVGHAVRAMYLYAAAAEVCGGDEPMAGALLRLFDNLTGRRMYVTGGIGPSEHNEGFTSDYDLPNRSAYAETCAAVGLAMWAIRLAERTGDGRFADVVERAILNGALAGMSLDATKYFYTNPLESHGEHARVPWFDCACCPPNVARLVLSLPRYLASVDPDARSLWLHTPAGLSASLRSIGLDAVVDMESNYPWSGRFRARVQCPAEVEFELRLRVPEWAAGEIRVLEGPTPSRVEKGYAVFDRRWNNGDTVEGELPMSPRWVEASPRVLDDCGRVCLMRGPMVYCMESVDSGFAPQRFRASAASAPEARLEPTLLGGLAVLRVSGTLTPQESDGPLYRAAALGQGSKAEADMIPYFAWGNRGSCPMQVWLARCDDAR